MDMCLLCADVGPVRPADYARNMHRPLLGAALATAGGPTTAGELPVGEAERVLILFERNFTSLPAQSLWQRLRICHHLCSLM
jgi:hypothetical protein